MKAKNLKDMSVAELKSARDALKSGTDKWWEFHTEWSRKANLEQEEHLLKLAESRAKREQFDKEAALNALSRRGVEPLPNGHHGINHER